MRMGGTMKEKERTRKRGMMKPSRRVKLLLIREIISFGFVLRKMQGKVLTQIRSVSAENSLQSLNKTA